MWVAKRFDLTWSDLGASLAHCVRPGNADQAAAELEHLWSPRDDALACLSVRSAFDLYLETRRFPPGTEIVFSAMTVADMPRIALRHGLVPVPADLDPATAAPSVGNLERACTSETRAVVLAHLFGGRMDVGELVAFAHDRGLEVVEDCAEAYSGPGFTGHPDSDVTLFSFGPIKHATALGGALARVRDPELLARMRSLHQSWPRQAVPMYAFRVLKYATLYALSLRLPYTLISAAARLLHLDLDRLTNRLTRGFGNRKLFRRIRRRPSAPLLRTLTRRLRQDIGRLRVQEVRGRRLVADAELGTACPGCGTVPNTFWLLPVLAEDPNALVGTLRRAGFAATRGRAFTVVGAETAEEESPGAAQIHEKAVYVPFYSAMPEATVSRLTDVLASARPILSAPQAATHPTHPPTSASTP